VDYFVQLIKVKHGKDISDDGAALGKLRSACEDAKKTLSSQEHAQVEIKSLVDGVDLSETLTRSKFEELNHDLFLKVVEMIDTVMSQAELGKGMVDEVVLIGGSTMIPKIRKIVRDYLGGKEVNTKLKPDEAVTFGAALLSHPAAHGYPRQQDLVGIDDEVLSDASQEEDNGVIVSHQCFHTRAKDFSHQWYQHYSRPQPHRNPSHHHLCTQAMSAMQKKNTVSSDHLHEKKLVRYVLCPPTSSDQLIPLKPLPTATIPSITETTTAPEGTNTVACPSIMCHISNHLNLQPANTSRFWVKRPLESPQPPAVWMTSSTKPDVTSMIPSIALLVLRQSCRPQRERCSSLSWPDCATAFGLSGVSSRNRHRRGTQDAI
jgi:hypothetical protein